MIENKTIDEMYSRFMSIENKWRSLAKTYTSKKR